LSTVVKPDFFKEHVYAVHSMVYLLCGVQKMFTLKSATVLGAVIRQQIIDDKPGWFLVSKR